MEPDRIRLLSLHEEVRIAIHLIRRGLGEMKAISRANDFYYIPLLLLAAGFERLAKCIYCFYQYDRMGEFPRVKIAPAGRNGHDIAMLLEWIAEALYDPEYLGRPAANQDLALLRDDPLVARIIAVLSEFGGSARYFHLDVVVGREPEGRPPEQIWQEIELDVLKVDDQWQTRLATGNLEELYETITTRMVIPLERVARALARLFTLGPLGPEARRVQPHLQPFLFLLDDEFGRRPAITRFTTSRGITSPSRHGIRP